jgi:signal transduction histidine kinase
MPTSLSVRARVTVVAGLALTLAVTLGLVTLYLLQVGSAHRTRDGQLSTYAVQVEQSAHNGVWPQPLPTSALDAGAEAQVLAGDGRTVLASTRSLTGLPAVYAMPPGATTPVRQKVDPGLTGEGARVLGTRATVDGRSVVVITYSDSDPLTEVDETFGRLLLIGVPGILLLACATVWLVVGRALRPVERIRRTVTEITAADLSQRVPEPRAHDEIAGLAHTMNDMLARLDESASRQRRFVADASHELRSPLAAIRTTLEVGLAHPDGAPWPEIARRAVRQSQRLETLVQQLLLLAKGDDHQLVARRGPVDLGDLVEEVRATSAVSAELDVAFDRRDAAVILGDSEPLSRMVRNILDNATRHARSRVTLSVLDVPPGLVHIEIADDGPGIAPEQRERVFDRFVRLEAGRDRASGSSGLGLAIAKEIADAHGGSITVDEAPLGGAHVRITLPRLSA